MRKIIIQLMLLSCFSVVSAQSNPEKWTINGVCTQIQFYTPSSVRILKYPVGGRLPENSLVVTATPENVDVARKGNTLSSSELTVKIDSKTGAVSFHTPKGALLLQEKTQRLSR